MKNSFIFSLILDFSVVERRRARLWLQSPLHNSRPNVLSLFDELCRFAHELGIIPTKEQLIRIVFSDSSATAKDLRYCSNFLLKNLEDFLVWEQFQSSPKQAVQLTDIYQQRGLKKHYLHQLKATQKKLAQTPHRHPEYSWQSYQLAAVEYRWDSAHLKSETIKLSQLEQQLHTAFITHKLRQACLLLAHQGVAAVEYEFPLIDDIVASAAQSPYAKQIGVRMYRATYLMCRSPEREDVFRAYFDAFSELATFFPIPEARDLLLFGINFCIRRINQGETAFLRETWALYQQGLANNLLLEKGRLNALMYNNIAGIAIRLGELDWADNFLNSYQRKIDNSSGQAFFTLNTARLAFARQQYTQALTLLQQPPPPGIIHQMAARILLLKTLYMQGEEEPLFTQLKNSRSFLSRRRKMGYHEQNYRHILQLLERLINCNFYDAKAVQELRAIIEQTEPLTEKEWLLEQVLRF